MKTVSLYRGQARTGIGEGPERPVHHGEQFLAADSPLDRDGELLAAARPWMTLDWRPADEQALGDGIEAWSYFPYGNLRFVIRLAAAGLYDRRAAYFAHGRAFPVEAFAGACDPGAWLGRSEAFDEPWNDGERPAVRLLGEPELVRPEDVLAESAVAGALLAHLYQGLVGGYPVVMAVPVKDFSRGGPLHALVSFARAALPLKLKADCRIRVFTRLPELFLRHLETNLLVIPESEAANALAARRDATLLDRTGAWREGRKLELGATRYAEAVLTWFLHAPGELLTYSGAISEHLPHRRLPQEGEIARVPAIYVLLNKRKEPSALGEWIKSKLLKKLSEQPTGLPWERLIRPEDWRSLSPGDLDAIVVLARVAEGEARTVVELAKAEAHRRHGRLLSADAVQKGSDVGQLAAAARRDPEIAADLARALSDGSLSEDRVLQLLESAEVRDQLDTRTILKLADSSAPLALWLHSRIESEPAETVTALVRTDRWRQWRMRLSLPGESLRQAALAWLASEAWQDRPGPAKRLEDWKQVVGDLGRLTGEELADLRSDPAQRFRWPWITPFQDVQLRDLCRLAGDDLGALAELAEGLDPQDLRYRFAGSVFEHVLSLAGSALREGLPPRALALLSKERDAVLPPYEAWLLFERTKHRRKTALVGLRRSIETFLDLEPVAALEAAERLLSAADDRGLIEVLRLWKGQQPPGRLQGEVGVLLDRLLPAAGRGLGAGRGAVALDPAVWALLDGAYRGDCWDKFDKEILLYAGSDHPVRHPVSRLSASLREVLPTLTETEREALSRDGWKTFAQVTRCHSLILRKPVVDGEPLPALEVAVLLLPDGGPGGAALRLLFLEAARGHACEQSWWDSLLVGCGSLRRPPDREEVAFNLILQFLSDLPAQEADAARRALEARMERLYQRRDQAMSPISGAPGEVPQGASR